MRVSALATRWIFPGIFIYPVINNICSATTAIIRIDKNGFNRAVCRTRSTLHTAVIILDHGLAVLDGKDSVGADLNTVGTANTFFDIEFEFCRIFEIA